MTISLEFALKNLSSLESSTEKKLVLANGFCTPGYWVIVATMARLRGYNASNISFQNRSQEDYAKALALHENLDSSNLYEYTRVNEGKNYSLLTQLAGPHDIDRATSSINSCIRTVCSQSNESKGLRDLYSVVGELHDNIWSHGMKLGFSMAQIYNGWIEFSLADFGLGFRQEMTRVGLEVESHSDAISWCMQEGNSTKMTTASESQWDQKVPDDMMGGSPYGSSVKTFDTENNHQGLGLFKLKELIKNYNGHLVVSSGDSLYTFNNTQQEKFTTLDNPWQGVAISCKFKLSKLNRVDATQETSAISDLMSLFGGEESK